MESIFCTINYLRQYQVHMYIIVKKESLLSLSMHVRDGYMECLIRVSSHFLSIVKCRF